MKGMTTIVKTVAGWVKVLIVLFGIYIILFGDVSPGGGFAGGVILASAYVLLMLGYGREFAEKNMPLSLALKIFCCGALAFGAIAVSGLFYGPDSFFWNFIYQKGGDIGYELLSAGTIALAECAIGIMVAAAMFTVIIVLSAFRPDTSADQKE